MKAYRVIWEGYALIVAANHNFIARSCLLFLARSAGYRPRWDDVYARRASLFDDWATGKPIGFSSTETDALEEINP